MQGAHGSKSCNWRASSGQIETVAFRLQTVRAEERVVWSGRIAVVLTLTLFTVAFGAGWSVAHVTPHPEHGSHITSTLVLPADDSTMDVYGNEVTEAVATYKLDASGALYEEHSPQTEVPRLGSPKT